MPRMKQCAGKSVLAKMTGDLTTTMGENAFKDVIKASSGKNSSKDNSLR